MLFLKCFWLNRKNNKKEDDKNKEIKQADNMIEMGNSFFRKVPHPVPALSIIEEEQSISPELESSLPSTPSRTSSPNYKTSSSWSEYGSGSENSETNSLRIKLDPLISKNPNEDSDAASDHDTNIKDDSDIESIHDSDYYYEHDHSSETSKYTEHTETSKPDISLEYKPRSSVSRKFISMESTVSSISSISHDIQNQNQWSPMPIPALDRIRNFDSFYDYYDTDFSSESEPPNFESLRSLPGSE